MAPSQVETAVVSHHSDALRRFLRRWAACSLAGGACVSAIDAALLQRREGYFTGGFLSTDHLQGPVDVLAFFFVSLLADVAVAGVAAGLTLWAGHRLRPRAALAAAFLAGVLPLLAADVVTYQLIAYFGDALDPGLMFELVGGSVNELFAVASAHLVTPVLFGASALAVCVAAVWMVNRGDRGIPSRRPAARALAGPVLLFAVALVATTAAISASDRIENGVVRKPAGKVLAAIADGLTDFDRDGFGIASRMVDPAPIDARVFPYAPDLPGNGVDENGVGGDLPGTLPPYSETRNTEPWRRRPDVVLIVLESFRFDLLGARHAGRPVTPVLDALAARGVSARQAFSHNGYTAQSRFHLLSGSMAGVGDGTSLVDDFKANGYFVAYVSGQDESFGGERYAVGFSRADVAIDARTDRDRRYSTFTTPGSLAVPQSVVEERVTQTLASHPPAGRPLFLYVNFHDTHFPYTHQGIRTLVSDVRLSRNRIVPAEREDLWASYVNTAANVDAGIGRVLQEVRRVRGADPAVIVTADHGESLFDDGFLGHGHALNDVQTRVPFIAVNLPLVIREPFGHVDFRAALGAALRTPDVAGSGPRLERAAAGGVFQYLGNVGRPRQIGYRTSGGIVLYDFRRRRVQERDGAWRQPEQTAGESRAEFLRVVHDWERMLIARLAESAR